VEAAAVQRLLLEQSALVEGAADHRGLQQRVAAIVRSGQSAHGVADVGRGRGQPGAEAVGSQDRGVTGDQTADEVDERLRFGRGHGGDALRGPEVRVLVLLHVVEGDEELVELAVLPPVAVLELGEAPLLVQPVAEARVDRAGGQQRPVGRQVDAGGQHRVDEARRVPHQHHAGLPEPLLPVRVVLPHPDGVVRRGGRRGHAAQQLSHLGTGVDHGAPRSARVALDGRGVLGPHDRADAGEVVAQRDVPQPALVEGRAEDVAVIGFRQPSTALEVAEDREVAEEVRVHPLPRDLPVQPAGVARGVHHVAGAHHVLDAVRGQVPDPAHAVVLVDDAEDPAVLADVNALARGVAEQDLVEAAPLDLERGGRRVGQPR
jgi:hypothetical protein